MKKGFSKDNVLMWEAFMGASSIEVDPEPMDQPEDVVMSFEPMDEIEPVQDEGDDVDLAVYSDIKKLAEYSKRILSICKEQKLEPWMMAQLVKASSFVSDVWHQLDAKADFANMGFEHSDNVDL